MENSSSNPYATPDAQAIAASRGKAMGVASLVLGILSLLCCLTGLGAFFGIIMGIIGLVLGSKARELLPPTERGMATTGWICSIVALCLCAAILFAVLGFFGAISALM